MRRHPAPDYTSSPVRANAMASLSVPPGTVRRMDSHLVDGWRRAMRAAGMSERTVQRAALIERIADETATLAHQFDTEILEEWLAAHDLRPNSKATYQATLRAWSRWLVQRGIRDDDPTIRMMTVKVPRRRARPITTGQLETLLHSPTLRRRTRLMVMLGAYQGLRASEIAALHTADIDYSAETLRVVGKGDVDALLPLHPIVKRDLLRHGPRNGYVFASPANRFTHVSRCSVSDVVRRAMRRAGVDGTCHQLRHWYGTALTRAGVPTAVVKDLMRHANIATTAIYVAVDDTQMREAIARLPHVA